MQTDSDGYDPYIFEKTLEPKYLCPICHKALKNPVQTECGHRFCEECLQPVLSKSANPVCPVDNEPLAHDGVFKDVCCKREILCLFCFCPNRPLGCEWKKELQYLENHLPSCEYKGCQCPNPGCTAVVAEKKLPEHQTICPYKPSDCKYCSQIVPAAQMEDHFTECSRFPMTCPGCGQNNIPRNELEHHQTEICDQAEIPCPFSKMGCEFKGLREAIQQHSKEQSEIHLNLLADALRDSQGKQSEIIELFKKMTEDVQRLQYQVSEQREALAMSNQNARALQGKLSLVEKNISEHKREIAEIKERVPGPCQASSNDQVTFQLQELSTAFREQERRLVSLESGAGRGGSLSGPMSVGASPMIAMGRRQDRSEHQLALHDIQLAEHDLKLQMLEATSYDGTYIWKIDDYSRRFQESLSGKTPSIYSPPFYVGRYGYKVCSRVYPNGDGMGKGTHLSLFFVIMKGEFDALLPWPFRQKVTFKLLDQDRQHDVGDTFRPDPTSTSFRRPTSNMNIASGCPLFIAHTNLQSGSYIKDDTMFIRISVDTTGLQLTGF